MVKFLVLTALFYSITVYSQGSSITKIKSTKINHRIDQLIQSVNRNNNSLYGENYNEIPMGVELITSEEEWLSKSPYKPCCCYYKFEESNKAKGLLYNLKAYQKIVALLESNPSSNQVCTKSQWESIFSDLTEKRTTVNQLNFNIYPGYYDAVWYNSEDKYAGYWVNENTLVAFSQDNWGEPMVDDFIDTETSSGEMRNSILALSIRIMGSENNQCKESTWYSESINSRGSANEIKFITKNSDWEKNYGIACCCYINFDANNEDYGLVYNKKAYENLLIHGVNINGIDYRVATERDWISLTNCCKNTGTYNALFNCDESNFTGFNLRPNGYVTNGQWHLPTEQTTGYWVGENNENTVYIFNCENKVDIQRINPSVTTAYPGYMIRLIKKEIKK